MRTSVVHHPSISSPSKPLTLRGSLARTFGGLAGFIVVTFLCGGLYILEEAFANPIEAGAVAVISAAFIIALAAMLLFFLVKPKKWPRAARHGRSIRISAAVARGDYRTEAWATRHDNSRTDLVYQRFYVDHSRIQP